MDKKEPLPAPLTEAEEMQLFELSKNPDPCARLQSNYYQLRQRAIFNQFKADLGSEPYYDVNERLKLQDTLNSSIASLVKEYDADIDLAVKIHLMMLGVVHWRPAA